MFLALRKLKKAKSKAGKDIEATETEKQVAQALFDLEVNTKELKTELQPIQFSAAQEVTINEKKKAIIVFVPVKYMKNIHKVHQRLVRELEKKVSGKQIIIVAQRKTQSKKLGQKVSYGKTWAGVKDSFLNDIAYPVEITGKRIRHKLDGSTHTRVFLEAKDKQSYDAKIETFNAVAKMLTGDKVTFEFN